MTSPAELETDPVREALAALGVRRLLFGAHDACFPSDPDEDSGVGTPYGRAAARLCGWVATMGFTGVQLGPQGMTSRGNRSPYDATMFSRNPSSPPLASFRRGGAFEGLAPEELARARGGGGRSRWDAAEDALDAATDAAFDAFEGGARPDLAPRLAAFRAAQAGWLERDALYDALRRAHGGLGHASWPRDRDAFADAGRRAELLAEHTRHVARYAFAQFLVHDEHERFRARAKRLGLALFGDLQTGASDADVWGARACFLDDYRLGAPPSRTNPEGQPWGYAVLDPSTYDGRAGDFFDARLRKAQDAYDGLRVDHPHGIVCPWVYRAGSSDPLAAVQHGARLFSSPDLPEHPGLARFAIARADQLDRAVARHADGWVRSLDDDQVARYARLVDRVVARTVDVACEVLSTSPLPLGRVLARHGLGRYRVEQKADLDDARDVYRAENARPEDWVMLGTHDTPSIWAVVRDLSAAGRARWTRHLAARLGRTEADLAAPGGLPHAMLAELFASRAENVSIFFTDLFGYLERYNAPGTVRDDNWSLRIPADFEGVHRERCARGEALDLRRALRWALEARGAEELARRLR